MTPGREREIRRIAGRDGQTWRSSAVSLVALNEVLDELDRPRAAADGLRGTVYDENHAAMLLRDMSHCNEGVEASACYRFVLDKGRELRLWE